MLHSYWYAVPKPYPDGIHQNHVGDWQPYKFVGWIEWAFEHKEQEMAKQKVKATKLTVGLPFNLGSLEFENDEAQQRASWSVYRAFVLLRNP